MGGMGWVGGVGMKWMGEVKGSCEVRGVGERG